MSRDWDSILDSIPRFPLFRNITPEDRGIFEFINEIQSCPSDYCWPVIWTWNLNRNAQISCANNLIVLLSLDSFGGKLEYSFLSISNETNTNEITEFIQSNNFNFRWLKDAYTIEGYTCKESNSDFDYIINIPQILAKEGAECKKLRNKLSQFSRANLALDITSHTLPSPDLFNKCRSFFSPSDLEISKQLEYLAFENIVSVWNEIPNLYLHVFMAEKEMQGFTVSAKQNNDTSVVLFMKSRIDINGLAQFMLIKTAEILSEKQFKHINLESDLGIENLKRSKSLYPHRYFKKYSLERN